MFKFLHAADIHLDSPLRGLEKKETAPVDAIRNACRRAMENMVRLAMEEKVAFALIAGDLYDSDWKDYNTGLFFTRQVARLTANGIPVYIAAGNHDAQNRITRALRPPQNVHIFDADRPQTMIVESVGAAVHGQSYARQDMTDNLASGYPDAAPGLFNIGLLHTGLTGRPGHAPYAPCTIDQLRSKGYRYWALGHVHAGEDVSTDPHIVFPGCIQGRHIRETGPKGCRIVTVADGEVVSSEHRDLDVIRWSRCIVDLDGALGADDALDRAAEAMKEELAAAQDLPVAMRLVLTGACAAHDKLMADPAHWTQEFKSCALAAGHDRLWIEKIEFRTSSRLDVQEALEKGDAFSDLIRSVRSAGDETGFSAMLAAEFHSLKAKLPDELTRVEDGLDPADPATVAEFLKTGQDLLVSRLLASEDDK